MIGGSVAILAQVPPLGLVVLYPVGGGGLSAVRRPGLAQAAARALRPTVGRLLPFSYSLASTLLYFPFTLLLLSVYFLFTFLDLRVLILGGCHGPQV